MVKVFNHACGALRWFLLVSGSIPLFFYVQLEQMVPEYNTDSHALLRVWNLAKGINNPNERSHMKDSIKQI